MKTSSGNGGMSRYTSPYRKGFVNIAFARGTANIHQYLGDPFYYFDCILVQEKFLDLNEAKAYMGDSESWKDIRIQQKK